jgi:predicted HicB family RNase H-like nuclease
MGGKTSNESKKKYNEKAYDRIQLVVKKGQRDKIKAHAATLGISLNSYIVSLIEKDLEK